jgi:hypothetical protein
MTSFHLCADGGANRLCNFLNENEKSIYLPDGIIGDFDSLSKETENYYRYSRICMIFWFYVILNYREHNVPVIKDEDQNHNDLEKCLMMVKKVTGHEPKVRFDACDYYTSFNKTLLGYYRPYYRRSWRQIWPPTGSTGCSS